MYAETEETMRIGGIDLGERPVFLAPMEDVTDISFRLMCKSFGADMVYTEFVSSDALIRSVNKTQQKLVVSDEERPVAIQIYGKDEFSEYWGRNTEGNVENPKLSTINSSIEVDSDSDYEYEINGEFVANDFNQNTLSHKKGIVSMVRADYTKQVNNLTTQSYNSANSQFTILTEDATDLNGLYAAFGEVVEGLDIVEKIYATETKEQSAEEAGTDYNATTIKPFNSMPVIKNVTVETYGVDYGIPETHEAFNYSQYLYELMNQYYSGNE